MKRLIKIKANTTIYIMFSLNLLVLVWAILWKFRAPYIGDGTERVINLLPFHGNTGWEMQLNILLFIPLGFFITAVLPNRALYKQLAAVLLTSIGLEAIQYVLAVGRSDITDLMLNTLGGLLGMAGFFVISKLFGKNADKAILITCIIIIIIELYVMISFAVFGQLNLGYMKLRL